MRVEKNSGQPTAIVLDERFDVASAAPFLKNYESIQGLAGEEVLIDFTHTQYIDSSALGMLINAQSFFGKWDCKVKLVNANEHIKRIFNLSRFDKSFDIS